MAYFWSLFNSSVIRLKEEARQDLNLKPRFKKRTSSSMNFFNSFFLWEWEKEITLTSIAEVSETYYLIDELN